MLYETIMVLLIAILCYVIYEYSTKNKQIRSKNEEIIRLQEGIKRQNNYIEQKNAGNEQLHQDNTALRKLNTELESTIESTVKEAVKTARKDSIKRQRSILKGQATEQLAPYINKNYNPKDYKFLGDPIDYVIFDGMSDNTTDTTINKIIFMDIKTGKSQLNKIQKKIKETILDGKVEFQLYRPEKDIEEKDK